jgi:AraC-like DNA-binding protein
MGNAPCTELGAGRTGGEREFLLNGDVDIPLIVTPVDRRRAIASAQTHFSNGEFDLWMGGSDWSEWEPIPTDLTEAYGFFVPVAALPLEAYPRTNYIAISFHRDLVVRELAGSPEPANIARANISARFDGNSAIALKLASLTCVLWNNLVRTPDDVTSRSTDFHSRAILTTILESKHHPQAHAFFGASSPAVPRHLKRAIEYIKVNISSAIELSEIAKHAGVSSRSLQTAFKLFKGMTPLRYLRTLRLEGVRKDLLSSSSDGVPIAEIARNWGLSHAGRFSAAYRDLFGELPSATRERR